MTHGNVWPEFFTVAGDATAMGFAHGEQYRKQISELAELRIDYLARKYDLGSLSVIERIGIELAEQIEHQAPPVYAETSATSRAAGVSYWQLLVAGAFSDIDDLVSSALCREAPPHHECTLIPLHLTPGEVVISGTWDTHAGASEYYLVLRREPNDGPATLALTTFGWPMQQGVTSAGLAFAIANLVASSRDRGLPYISVLPMVAACETLGAALQILETIPHCSGRFYSLADESTCCGVEVVPGVGVFAVSGRCTPHTNHYVFEGAREWEGRPAEILGSETRLHEAIKCISSRSLSSLTDALGLYTDKALTQHGSGDEDRTGATFVLVPRERALYFVNGAPSVSDLNARVRRHTL